MMKEFFHGWRRKTGCVTLIMALVLVGTWTRAFYVEDTVTVTFPQRQHALLTSESQLIWFAFDSTSHRSQFVSWTSAISNGWRTVTFDQNNRISRESLQKMRFRKWTVAYWKLAIPLTLLSACLILWKPRPAK